MQLRVVDEITLPDHLPPGGMQACEFFKHPGKESVPKTGVIRIRDLGQSSDVKRVQNGQSNQRRRPSPHSQQLYQPIAATVTSRANFKNVSTLRTLALQDGGQLLGF